MSPWDELLVPGDESYQTFALEHLRLAADNVADSYLEPKSHVVAEAVVFEIALRMIVAGHSDPISVATTALRATLRPGETMADVLREHE